MKCNVEKFDARRVVVDIEGTLEEYALAFLSIFNNVRENKELLSVTNEYGSNRVAVTCDVEYLEETKNWLSHFGKVEEEAVSILGIKVDEYIDYDLDKYWGLLVVEEEQ